MEDTILHSHMYRDFEDSRDPQERGKLIVSRYHRRKEKCKVRAIFQLQKLTSRGDYARPDLPVCSRTAGVVENDSLRHS